MMDAIERAGMGALLSEECGPRRLLPRALADAFTQAHSVMDAIDGTNADVATVALVADQSRQSTAAIGAAFGATQSTTTDTDAVLMSRALLEAMDLTRVEWGRWMLTAGVALGAGAGDFASLEASARLACVASALGDAADLIDRDDALRMIR